jgi:hypothetical protein
MEEKFLISSGAERDLTKGHFYIANEQANISTSTQGRSHLRPDGVCKVTS